MVWPWQQLRLQCSGSAADTRACLRVGSSPGLASAPRGGRLRPRASTPPAPASPLPARADVEPQHLLNIKSAIERRENMLWFRVPPKVRGAGGPRPAAAAAGLGTGRAGSVGG